MSALEPSNTCRTSVLLLMLLALGCNRPPKDDPKEDASCVVDCEQHDPPGPPFSCFARGTQVATPYGSTSIERLAVGDEVQSYDFSVSRVVTRRVTHIFAHEPAAVLRFDGSLGEPLLVTPNHPVYSVAEHSFIRADRHTQASLTLGLTSLWSVGLTSLMEQRDESTESAPVVEVFDITVDGTHNFFAEGILVHNKQPRCSEYNQVNCWSPQEPGSTPCYDANGTAWISTGAECPPIDNGATDASFHDAAALDGSLQDATRNTSLPDGSLVDASRYDASRHDATLLDAESDNGDR